MRPDEGFEVPPGQRLDRHLVRLGKGRERREVARVALHRVRRHAANVAEVGQVDVNHGSARIHRPGVNADPDAV